MTVNLNNIFRPLRLDPLRSKYNMHKIAEDFIFCWELQNIVHQRGLRRLLTALLKTSIVH